MRCRLCRPGRLHYEHRINRNSLGKPRDTVRLISWMCSVVCPVPLDEVNGIEHVVFDVFFWGNNRICGAARRTCRQHDGAARMVPQHHTLSEWRGVGDRAISLAIVFYAEDVAHRELCLARSKHSNGICKKTKGGTTNLRCMCAVYQLLSMLRMWPIENCA